MRIGNLSQVHYHTGNGGKYIKVWNVPVQDEQHSSGAPQSAFPNQFNLKNDNWMVKTTTEVALRGECTPLGPQYTGGHRSNFC